MSSKPPLRSVPPPKSAQISPGTQPSQPAVEELAPRDSNLPEFLRKSLFYFSGVKGVGKSYLAASLDRPDNVICFDFESKGELAHAQLGYGKYVDMVALVSERKRTFKHKPQDMFEVLETEILSVPKNRYTVMILDNIDPLQQAVHAEVVGKAISYGLNPAKAQAGSFGEDWRGTNNLVSNICQLAYSRGIRVIVVISHVGHPWTASGPDLRKWNVKGVETFNRLSCLSLILVPGDTKLGGKMDVPAAIVKKESLAFAKYDDELKDTIIRRRIPYRFPRATGKAIRDYCGTDESKWFDSENPRLGEMPVEDELKPYRDLMTDSEWREIVRAMEVGVRAEEQAKERALLEEATES